MANRLYKAPAVTVTPGTPGTPPIPAFCVDEPVYVDYSTAVILQQQISITQKMTGRKVGQVYYTSVGGQLRPAIQQIDPRANDMFTGPGVGSGVYVAYILRTCYPGSPGTPAVPDQITYDALPGWNSGGLSNSGFLGDGYVEFQIGVSSIGVIAGLNTGPDTLSPADCSHAFYGRTSGLDVYEDGQLKFSVPGGLSGTPVLRIARAGTEVKYFVNGEVVYTSAKPSSGFARLDASLYMAGDYVDNPFLAIYEKGSATVSIGATAHIDARPRVAAYVGVSASAQGLAGSSRYGAARGFAGTEMTATGVSGHFATAVAEVGITVSARAPLNYAANVAAPAIAFGSESGYSFADARYTGSYSVDSYGGFPTIEFAYGAGFIARSLVYAYGPSGGLVNSDSTLAPAVALAAEGSYAIGKAVYKGGYFVEAYAPWLSSDSAALGEPILLQDSFVPYAAVMAEFKSVVEVQDTVLLELVLEAGAEWLDALFITDSVAELHDKSAEWTDTVFVTDQNMTAPQASVQIVTNTMTAAPTTYDDFAFMKIFDTPYGTYGLKEDGVYRIGNSGDTGINAYVDIGADNFGSLTAKRLTSVFFGMRTNGDVIAVLRDDSEIDRTYLVTARDAYMRFDPARGVSSKYWRLRLELTDATEGDMDNVEFMVSDSARWVR